MAFGKLVTGIYRPIQRPCIAVGRLYVCARVCVPVISSPARNRHKFCG